MDRATRLADYLAGQLDPEERTALEAELARDPALRADLDAMRTADDHLAMIPPATPPSGFEERLDAAISSEVAAVLDHAGGAPEPAKPATTVTATDELAAHRARAERPGLPRWVTAASGAAAALVVLAGAGLVFSNILGGDDTGDDAIFETQSLDAIEEDAFDTDAEAFDDADSADGPLLLGGDRSLDDQDVQAILEDPDAFGIAARNLDDDTARGLAAPFAEALGAGSVGEVPESPDAEADAGDDASIAEDAPDGPAADADTPSRQGAPAELRIGPDVSDADRAQVGTCLELLLSDTTDVIPTYAELIVFEGAEAIVFGLISEDPATGLFTRREAWVLDRDSCEVRLFTQR